MGIQKDANLVQNQYNLLGAVGHVCLCVTYRDRYYLLHWVSYCPTSGKQVVTIFSAGKVRCRRGVMGGILIGSRYTSVNIIIWGTILACSAAAKSYASLMVVRCLLGVFEASITPGFILLTSQWYRKYEQGSRTGLWFSCNGLAQVIGGCIAYSIARDTAGKTLSVAPWQVSIELVCKCH